MVVNSTTTLNQQENLKTQVILHRRCLPKRPSETGVKVHTYGLAIRVLPRNTQTCYHDLMRTCEELFSRKSKLDWEIRFAPKHNDTEDKIREMGEECKSVVEKQKKIEEDKGPTQRRLKQLRKAIIGTATISSKNDRDEWETHTPVPTDNEEEK